MRAIASTILLAALTFGAPALSDSSAALNNLKSCRRECTRSCDQLANERDCIAACRTQCLAREYKKDSAPAVSYGDHDPLGPGDPNPLPNPLVRPPTIAHPTTHTGHARGRPKARIIDTRSAPLLHPGDEEAGYGLYTYVLLRGRTDRDSHFLKDIVATAPSAAGVAPPLRAQIDLMLIPANSCPAGTATSATNCAAPEPEIIPGNLKASYNFEESNAILEELCTNPPEQVVKFCREPFGEGPFLFTYALPVSKMNSIPPPFLFFDFTDQDEAGFPDYIDAYEAVLKSDDFTDDSKLKTLRLRILDIYNRARAAAGPTAEGAVKLIHLFY